MGATNTRGGIGWIGAVVLALAFIVFQAWVLGYGTTINDVAHIRAYHAKIPQAVSALQREAIVASDDGGSETLEKWMLRFKLYSVDADEMVSVMALARISPAQRQFDPHFYQYGGAWLYPLGLWYAALSAFDLIRPAPLEDLLAEPARMDDIYRFGRLFVVFAVAVAGLFLFAAAAEIATPGIALWAMTLFLASPATIYFSLTMKPHWYALLFVNGALTVLSRLFVRGRWSAAEEACLGIALGLAVGSATSFSIFAVVTWLALGVAACRGAVRASVLLRVPLIALLVFAASNPFVLVNQVAVRSEAVKLAGWFVPAFGVEPFGEFIWNSLLPGFGIALIALVTLVALRELARPTFPFARPFIFAIVAGLAAVAVLTANLSYWNTNQRYAAYVLPASLLLMAATRYRPSSATLAIALALTVAQFLPLRLAFLDEDDPERGTRLAAARWIDANISAGTGVCLGTPTPVPFDTPPFDLARYRVNATDCGFLVRVERYAADFGVPAGFAVVKQFRPRLSFDAFALTFGHINPRISVYRRV